MDHKLLVQKNFWTKTILSQSLDPKIFWICNNFWSKRFRVQKSFVSKKIFGFMRTKKNCGVCDYCCSVLMRWWNMFSLTNDHSDRCLQGLWGIMGDIIHRYFSLECCIIQHWPRARDKFKIFKFNPSCKIKMCVKCKNMKNVKLQNQAKNTTVLFFHFSFSSLVILSKQSQNSYKQVQQE